MTQLSHIDAHGQAHMVDVSDKRSTIRIACAETYVQMLPDVLQMITEGLHKKGDVLAVARIAGIQAAKKCSDWIPLCHPLMLTKVSVTLVPDVSNSRMHITSYCKLQGQTGVEMEALCAVSAAALTLYDMCKAVDKGMVITGTRLLEKKGGESGSWQAP